MLFFPSRAGLAGAKTAAAALLLILTSAAGVEAADAGCGMANLNKVAWRKLETPNFRILASGADDLVGAGRFCESLRDQLIRRWMANAPQNDWQPHCDIVLHPSDASYDRSVVGGKVTVASSLIDCKRGAVIARRIDVRAYRRDWREALPHELTHLVLADHLQSLPACMDEGAAMLADPIEKQARHMRDLRISLRQGTAFRLVELLECESYPPPDRWAAFYGQSLSLAQYLMAMGTHADFVQFAKVTEKDGAARAVQRVYHLNGIAELELGWLKHVRRMSSTRLSQCAEQTTSQKHVESDNR